MKPQPPHADSIGRWRDRPRDGAAPASDEDRAAALARDALLPRAFPVGLDDRQLERIEERLKTQRRARPPLWLRPALVAALLTASVASVMGYETGWFAPLRERLRFRSIPPVAPEPVEHARKHAARAAAPAVGDTTARADAPSIEIAAPAVAPPPEPAPPPVAARPPAARSASAPPPRKLALADGRPPAPPAGAAGEPTAASPEIQALEQAVGLLRGKHDAPAALAALDDYLARFPGGVFAHEARVARVDALLLLDRSDDALRALEALPLDAHRRSTELQLIRGELRARTDCGRAEADFSAVLARVRTPALEERALYGRGACRSKRGDAAGAADDLRRYVERFPGGAHAAWARRWLDSEGARGPLPR